MNGDDTLDVGKNADVNDYTAMVNFFKTTDLSVDANYAAALTKLDIDNFTDYMAAEIYSGNTDWPVRNVKLWRARVTDPTSPTYGDGRWRWLFYDTDYAFQSATEQTLASALNRDVANESISTKVVFSSLSRNPGFRQQFAARLDALMNGAFSPASVSGQLSAFSAAVLPEMPAHIRRWQYPATLESWQSSVNAVSTFASQRPAYLRSVLSAYVAGN